MIECPGGGIIHTSIHEYQGLEQNELRNYHSGGGLTQILICERSLLLYNNSLYFFARQFRINRSMNDKIQERILIQLLIGLLLGDY